MNSHHLKGDEMKRLTSVVTNQYSLEVVECVCGYHMGVDASYLLQVGDLILECPVCNRIIATKTVFPEGENPTFHVG